MQKLPHSRSLRKGRFSAANNIYLITMVTHERRKLFESFPLARLAINQLSRVDAEKSASTFAFVVMPDHIHWLCQLNGEVTLSRVVQKFKSAVTRELRLQATDSPRAVWQKGFHDHAIRKDEDIAAIARYVIENPVRAGLVSDVRDYSHWNCIWLL
jgi:REP element-mobilizing transposase RayT